MDDSKINPMSDAVKHPTIEGGFDGSSTGSSQVQSTLATDEDRLEEIKRLREKMAKEEKELKKKIKANKAKPAQPKLDAAKKVNEFVPFQIRGGGIIMKKAAYIRNNRMINPRRVEEFMSIIQEAKYVDDYPIIVMAATKFHEEHPEIIIEDADGKPIADDELDNYFIILDGQHREQAHALLYQKGIVSNIPGVVVRGSIGDVAQFLRSINPKGSWSNEDVAIVCGLSIKGKYQKLMEEINKLVRQGFNRSTASQIFCGKPLTSRQFNILVAGDALKNDVPFNLDKGGEFIACCTKAGITSKFLTKRHFIEGYLDFKTTNGEKIAEFALNKLPKFDEKMLKAIKSKDDFIKYLEEASMASTN